MQARHYSQQECTEVVRELMDYRAGLSPFNAPLGTGQFNAKNWWRSAAPQKVLCHLACFLFDITPHAATTERIFSLMGWYHDKTRNRLTVDATGKLTAIKTYYEQDVPRRYGIQS